MDYNIKENHWQCGCDNRTFLSVDHYNERGLDTSYFWQKILFKPTPSNEDMEAARLEACNVFLKMGGYVIITILDSLQIPENDRNAPLDMREGHEKVIGRDHLGFPIVAKKETGDPGDRYYDWKPITPDEVERKLVQVRKLLYDEQKRERKRK